MKLVYLDRTRRAKTKFPGEWVAVERKGSIVQHTVFRSEAEARASIGLEGGSPDPEYRPKFGETNFEAVTADA